MDATDLRILRAFQDNPDLPVAELAAAVGLSHTPCWRRLKRLEEQEIILGKAALLNMRRLGFTVSVFANVRLKQHDEETLDAFEQAVCAHAAIVECFSMSGESDYILRIVAQSIDDYERFLKKVLLHLPAVASVNSSFALKNIKLTTKLPL